MTPPDDREFVPPRTWPEWADVAAALSLPAIVLGVILGLIAYIHWLTGGWPTP